MSVYFVTCREANAVKIGSSLDPRHRLKEIQWGCPLPVKLEGVMSGRHEREFELHRQFADDRLTGEWFTINEIIEGMIAANRAPEVEPKEAYSYYRPPCNDKTLTARIRARLRIKQTELADMLGTTASKVSVYERGGRVPPEIKVKLEALAIEAAQ